MGGNSDQRPPSFSVRRCQIENGPSGYTSYPGAGFSSRNWSNNLILRHVETTWVCRKLLLICDSHAELTCACVNDHLQKRAECQPSLNLFISCSSPSLLIRGTASDVAGIDSETVLRNTVSESRIVTSEMGNGLHDWREENTRDPQETETDRGEDGKRDSWRLGGDQIGTYAGPLVMWIVFVNEYTDSHPILRGSFSEKSSGFARQYVLGEIRTKNQTNSGSWQVPKIFKKHL